jgi:hypothetical protein
MKIGALILGILGGLVALAIGFFGFALGSMSSDGGALKIVSLVVPIAALVGAGMVMSKPFVGSLLMGGSAVALILILGFNSFSLIPVVLLALGAGLGFLESKASPAITK